MAESTIKNALSRFQILNKLLKEYDWLINSYIVEFFTCENYKKLPLSWREMQATVELEEIGHFLLFNDENNSCDVRRVWPLSLLCLQRLITSLSLPRKQHSSISTQTQLSTKEIKVTACLQHHKLKNLFVKNVKPKKRHEITLMAEETVQLAAKSGVSWVLDAGSGVGHLCRILAYGYALKVCGIESQHQLNEKAKKLDAELEVTASKHLSSDEITFLRAFRPKHTTAMIGATSAQNDTEKILKDCASSEECPDFGIIGLHPCGDLAVTLLQIFVSCPHAKFINIVGCCYHKMTINSSPETHSGFPLSSLCAQESPCVTTVVAGLGCHAIETYSSRLILKDYDHLKVHCYRAALERIIIRHWPQHGRWGVSNVSHYPDLPFPEYCRKALQRFPLPIPEEDFESLSAQQDLQSWKEVVFYYSMLLQMGPATESIILLDRLMYLHENGIEGQLKALFDASISPRNQVLSAIKKKL